MRIIFILFISMLTLLSCTQDENKNSYIPKPSPPSGYITKSYNYDLGKYEYIPSNAFSTKAN